MDAAPLYPVHQSFRSSLQINDQIGRGGLGLKVLINFSVKPVLSVIQREPGEQWIFVEQKIADRRVGEHIDLGQTLQLIDALEKEE